MGWVTRQPCHSLDSRRASTQFAGLKDLPLHAPRSPLLNGQKGTGSCLAKETGWLSKVPGRPREGVEWLRRKNLESQRLIFSQGEAGAGIELSKWEPKLYSDEYHEALEETIDKKIQSGVKLAPAPAKKKRPTNVVDLMSVLKQSLSERASETKSQKAAKNYRPKSRKKAA
jgi:hypothetical protein